MPSPTDTPAPDGRKTLWAATLVLVVVVMAMGAALIRIQSRPIEPRLAVLPKPSPTPATPTTPKKQAANTISAPANQASSAMGNAAGSATEISARPQPVMPNKAEPAVLRPPEMGASVPVHPESQQTFPR